MNLEIVKQGVTRFGGRTLLTLRRYSPEILTGLGILGGLGTVVIASKQTLKLPEITDKIDDARHNVRHKAETDLEYAKNSYKSELKKVYIQGSWDVVKLYAPAVGLGLASTACILSAHGILRSRNAALAAAYVTLDKAYQDYRKRVAEEYGEEEERKIYVGQHEISVEDEDGKPMALTTISGSGNPYGRWFDEGSVQFSREPGYNMRLLLAEQNIFNDRLKSRGYVFLNEVYERLGLPISREGVVVGWYYDPKRVDELEGDDYVDFGIMNPEDPNARDFINGWNKVVWLDFNVQGPILDYIPKSS